MEDPAASFDLSSEQRDNATLLRDLLGPAMAARYEDFCRLSSGAFALNVSAPMAAHALRDSVPQQNGFLDVPDTYPIRRRNPSTNCVQKRQPVQKSLIRFRGAFRPLRSPE